MLEHLSPKFRMPPVEREPRAALILNRFTRNLTIMFATNSVASVLGFSPDQVKDKSFYRCIQERCLPDALKCLESAKANDSIAYLRFWSRDPNEEDDSEPEDSDEDELMAEEHQRRHSTCDSEGGGAELGSNMDVDLDNITAREIKKEEDDDEPSMEYLPSASSSSGQGSSGNATSSSRAGNPYGTHLAQHEGRNGPRPRRRRNGRQSIPSVELEAVVSCTSDGLVVVLRKARPQIPPAHPPLVLPPWDFENGLFAAPWAQQPVRPHIPPEMLYTFRPPLLPQFMPLRESIKAAGGPPMEQLMRSIRDVAVFAWALCGINGNLSAYSHGRPAGEAVPPEGLPTWDSNAVGSIYEPPENQAAARWAAMVGNSDDKGHASTVQQPLSPAPPYHAPSYHTATFQQDPRYGLDTDYTHDAINYPAQQTSYEAGYTSMPQHHQQQQQQQQQQQHHHRQHHEQQQVPPHHPTHHIFPPPTEPWRSEPQARSPGLSVVSAAPFADPTTQTSGRANSPHSFTRGWQ